MPTYQRAPQNVEDLALAILEEFEDHAPILKAGVKVDFIFAFADLDEKTGEPINNAITARGFRALGQCRKISLKDRSVGRGDAEIVLDADHWKESGDAERKALLDHELTHIEVKEDERGHLVDDLGRPVLKMRKHDLEVGWFHNVAQRHGLHSCERIQAKQIMDAFGQYYFPGLCIKNEEEQPAKQQSRRFTNIAKDMTVGGGMVAAPAN